MVTNLGDLDNYQLKSIVTRTVQSSNEVKELMPHGSVRTKYRICSLRYYLNLVTKTLEDKKFHIPNYYSDAVDQRSKDDKDVKGVNQYVNFKTYHDAKTYQT